MPFPKDHLSLVKHIKVTVSPFLYGSARKMAEFLQILTGPEISLTDLSVHIHIDFTFGRYYFDQNEQSYPVPTYADRLLTDRDPIVRALFAPTTVKKLCIRLVDHARYGPGVADHLQKHFQGSAAAEGRSIIVEKVCIYSYDEVEYTNKD